MKALMFAPLLLGLSVTASAQDAELHIADCYNEGEPELHGEALRKKLEEADRELAAILHPPRIPRRRNDVEPLPIIKGE